MKKNIIAIVATIIILFALFLTSVTGGWNPFELCGSGTNSGITATIIKDKETSVEYIVVTSKTGDGIAITPRLTKSN